MARIGVRTTSPMLEVLGNHRFRAIWYVVNVAEADPVDGAAGHQPAGLFPDPIPP